MIKNNLRYRMVDKNIVDIQELMNLSGLSRNTLKKLYRNIDVETIKLETLVRLCDALDCDLSELIEYSPK